ncbi:MAG: sugar phosphorylase [bacterium]|nr:sugar phosphorylase [bacterium]
MNSKKTVAQRLELLYTPDDARAAGQAIAELVDAYQKRIQSRDYELNERDVILITYGDQVHSPGQASLKTLREFLNDTAQDTINSVHILPFFPYSSDDGFSVIDYLEVNPRLGRWADVEAFRDDEYRLMFDCVINHISQHSHWFRRYLACDPEYADYFTHVDPKTDLSDVVRPRTSPLLTDFTDADGRQRSVWCTFSADQVDLNYANYRVLVSVLQVLFEYVARGANLIRLDAIAFVWKDIGTGCVHLPQTHEVIQLMREVLHQVAPEVIIITETNVPHKENISYFGNGEDEAQMVYNFALPPLLAYSILKGETTTITEWARTLKLPGDRVCFFNFTASHDGVGLRPVQDILAVEDIRFLVHTAEQHGGRVSYRTGADGKASPYEINCNYLDLLTHPAESDDLRVAHMLLSQAVVLAMPGVPGVYFHSLVGSRNYLEGVEKTGVNRSINREKLGLADLQSELADPEHLRCKVFTAYRRLLQIRCKQPAFQPYGEFEFPETIAGVFAILRRSQDPAQEILALHNFTGRVRRFPLTDAWTNAPHDLIADAPITLQDDRAELQPYQVLWLSRAI